MNEWVADALCRTEGHPDMFFTDSTGPSRDKRTAKDICRRCTVAQECLTEALRRGERYGIWAGFDMGLPYSRQAARKRSA